MLPNTISFWIFFKALFIQFCQICNKVVFSNGRVSRLGYSIPITIPSSNVLQYLQYFTNISPIVLRYFTDISLIFFRYFTLSCSNIFRRLHLFDISLQRNQLIITMFSILFKQCQWKRILAENSDISNSSFWMPIFWL